MKNIISLVCFVFISSIIFGQERYFTDAVEIFSKKKISYVTLADGEEIEGNIKRMKTTKGLMKELKLKMADGSEKVLLPGDIQSMYLAQNEWDKVLEAAKMDVTKWDDEDVNSERLKDGYAYFESVEVNYRKKKTETLLLQMVNPSFSNKVKVFFDPLAAETTSASVGGIKLAGGIDKSYFIKTEGEVGYRLKKKDYKDSAQGIMGDCKPYWNKIKKDLSWSDFPEHLFNHASACME